MKKVKNRRLSSKERKTEMRINEGKKPFVLQIGKMHAQMVSNLPDYTIWGVYDFLI